MVPSSRTPLRPDRLRALNLPSAVEVGLDEWGRPTWVVESEEATAGQRGSGAEQPAAAGGGGAGGGAAAGGRARAVDEVVETWVVQDEWWRTPINRRYVEVVLEGGAHVVLFEDLTTGEWFMQRP
jgi:hypothetical protein